MPISKINAPSSGFDFSQVTPIHYEQNMAVTTTNTWQTLYSFNGKGFLSKLFLYLSSSYTSYIRLTLDGSVMFYGEATNNPNYPFTGIIPEQDLVNSYNGASLLTYVRQPTTTLGLNIIPNNGYMNETLQLPVTSMIPGVALVNNPIYFKQSILVEIQSTYTGYINYVEIKGGKI